MLALFEIAEESFKLLEKAATEADAFEAENKRLQSKLRELEQSNAALQKAASAAPTINRNLLLKVAQVLEEEELLRDDVTAEKMATAMAENPNTLADILLRIVRPVAPEGKPTKAASVANPSPGAPNVVEFEGRKVIDRDGWLKVIAK